MSKSLTAINIILVITDLILSALVVLAFAWGAWHFSKWWLVLFTLVPALTYTNHSIIIDSDIRQNRIDELNGKGDDNNSES